MNCSSRRICLAALTAISLVSLGGCVPDANQAALKIGGPPEGAVELRSMQSRRFDSLDEKAMLSAATDVLQDTGFIVSEASAPVGALAGSKQRDAEESGQVAGQVAITILFALMGSNYQPQWDTLQRIHVTLVLTPVQNSKQTEVDRVPGIGVRAQSPFALRRAWPG